MPHFTFVTTNKEKIATAGRHLEKSGIIFNTEAMDLEELQSDNAEEIAIRKAEQAFQKLQRPVVISDHNWAIPALGGFPGPYMKYINQWLSTVDMQNLMAGHSDKSIIKTEVLCYRDEKGLKVISYAMHGRFMNEPRGQGLPVMNIVTFQENDMSVSECIKSGIDISPDYKVWEEFATWYQQNR